MVTQGPRLLPSSVFTSFFSLRVFHTYPTNRKQAWELYIESVCGPALEMEHSPPFTFYFLEHGKSLTTEDIGECTIAVSPRRRNGLDEELGLSTTKI